MWFYELRGAIRPGVPVFRLPAPRIVIARYDSGRLVQLVIPIDDQLQTLLSHSDDVRVEFELRFGEFDLSKDPVTLSAQTEQEASRDRRAALFVPRLADTTLGESLTFSRMDGGGFPFIIKNCVLIFEPGDKVQITHKNSWRTTIDRICWDADSRQLHCETTRLPRGQPHTVV